MHSLILNQQLLTVKACQAMLGPMGGSRTYTLSELEGHSGFDKRTIAYYVQESLLPKVGRRGPRTRYSEEFLDRLMFIRRVRNLQDTGQLRAVTLGEIRDVIATLLPEETRRAAQDRGAEETFRSLFAEPDLETSEVKVAGGGVDPSAPASSERLTSDFEESDAKRESLLAFGSMETGRPRFMRKPSRLGRDVLRGRATSESDGSPDASDHELRTLLQEVEHRARLGVKQSKWRSREHLTRVPITEDISLSVRNITNKDAHLVEKLAALLRRIGGFGREHD